MHDEVSQILLAIPFIVAMVVYLIAVVLANKRHKPWPLYRTVFFIFGVIFALTAVTGPLADLAHMDFSVHMISHLLLGMLVPLLIVLAAPMTLILRTLNVSLARRLSRMLKSWPSRFYTHPIVASILNIGGLWLLYTTELYSLMYENLFLHFVIHFHLFVAGYLYTVSLIYIDPIPHRFSFLYRSIVFILSLAAHGILSKIIYANPPSGVPIEQAKLGGMLMYYGGDAVEVILIFILCMQWYKGRRVPRTRTRLTLKRAKVLIHK